MKVSIIIPAYNEEKRIERTLINYCNFFDQTKRNENIEAKIITVLNGCTDKTYDIVLDLKHKYKTIEIINLKKPGKGLAVIAGFKSALRSENDLIGFVDADMATKPKYYYELIKNIKKYDAIIASRYMKGAQVTPKRPFIKDWGRKIVYNPLNKILFGINYKDFQCGAKLFKPYALKGIVNKLKAEQWAFDVELLYLCKKNKFDVKEIPTIWHDQTDSKFKTVGSGLNMIASLFKLRLYHSPFSKFFNTT